MPIPIPKPPPLLYGGPGPTFAPPGGANFFKPPVFGLIYYPGPLERPLILIFNFSPYFNEKSAAG